MLVAIRVEHHFQTKSIVKCCESSATAALYEHSLLVPDHKNEAISGYGMHPVVCTTFSGGLNNLNRWNMHVECMALPFLPS